MNPWTTYGATLEYIPMFVMQPDIMATSCRAFLHLCTFLLSLMFSLSFPKLSILVTYFWWAYLVKNWSHQLVIFLTLNNLGKLVQTPSEGCIVFKNIIIDIVEFSMVLRSSVGIFSPLGSLSSMKVWIPLKSKASYKWLIKLWQVSWPLKLKKTSKFLSWLVKEEDETPLLVTRAIRIYEQTVAKIWREEKKNCKRVVKKVNHKFERGWMQAREDFKGGMH